MASLQCKTSILGNILLTERYDKSKGLERGSRSAINMAANNLVAGLERVGV